MQFAKQIVVLCALTAAVTQAASTQATALAKVVEMLQGMATKAKELKNAEKVEFGKTEVLCEINRKQFKADYKVDVANNVEDKASMNKANSNAEGLAADIKTNEAEINQHESELTGAVKIRSTDNADYSATASDMAASIAGIANATASIKAKSGDVKQSLLQVKQSSFISAEDKAVIESFLAFASGTGQTPEAASYESQSGGLMDVLEKLTLKFADQKIVLETEEAASAGASELLQGSLNNSIKEGEQEVSDEKTEKGSQLTIAATAEGDVNTVDVPGMAADDKSLADLNTQCDTDAKDFDKNQNTRANEINAIESAIATLAGNTVSGAATKHNVGAKLLQDGSSFVQALRGEAKGIANRRSLVAFLQSRAHELDSKYLSLAAAQASVAPFAALKLTITELIVKLVSEANADGDQKEFCDEELKVNKITRDRKTSQVDSLVANVEKSNAEISQMGTDISTLSDEIGALKQAMATGTDNRNAENKLNSETISEAKAAIAAVVSAVQVLRDFYGEDSAASFLQVGASDEAPYSGQGSAGVFSLLETVASDFATLESTTSTAEGDAAAVYQKLMDDSTQDSEVKATEMNHIENKKQKAETIRRNEKKELKTTQEELDTALNYYEKLRPDCIDTGLAYQDRITARKQEIRSLQEALATIAEEA